MRVRVPLNDRIVNRDSASFSLALASILISILELDEPGSHKKERRPGPMLRQFRASESYSNFVVPLKIRCPVLGLILRVLF